MYFLPAANVRERIAQEMSAVTFKEFALQDANTLEATQMTLESGYVERFPLNDQEVLLRHLHTVVADWVDDHLLSIAALNHVPDDGPHSLVDVIADPIDQRRSTVVDIRKVPLPR